MPILNQIMLYMVMTMVIIVLMFICGIVIFVLSRRKKTSIYEVTYENFDRHDSMEYLKFDEIISSEPDSPLKGAGVMVINQRTFVAALNVTGYNFFQSSREEQEHTIQSTISLMKSLEHPISLRQTVKAIDIGHNIDVFEQEAMRIQEEINELTMQAQNLIQDAEDYIDTDPKRSEEYVEESERIERVVERRVRQLNEAREMVRYMKEISTESQDTQKVQTLLFTYKYDNTQFTNALTKEEIYSQAMIELNNMAENLKQSLSRCGCTARRCSAEEMVDLMRRHMHPATGDDDTIEDLFHSDIGSLFVTSQSLFDVVKSHMTEEAYERQLEEINAKIEEEKLRRRLADERAEADMMEVTRQMAQKEVRI